GGTLGRARDNDLSLTDRELSRRHSKACTIEYDDTVGAFFLCDTGSLNGTYVHLVGPYSHGCPGRRLDLGDHVMVGRTGLSVNRFDYGISERLGARPSMEDKSTVMQDLAVPNLVGPLLWPQTFAGVYDGHGGGEAAEYLWVNLHRKVAESLASRAPELLAAAAAAWNSGDLNTPSGRSWMQRRWSSSSRSLGGGKRSSHNPTLSSSFRPPRRGGFGGVGGQGGGKGRHGEAITEAFAVADEEFMSTSGRPEVQRYTLQE
ncbi:unnamed protein product, partial [Discosporangium mesarthrocarpum]